MRAPPKILHVITGLNVGGAETMLSRLVRWSSSDRHRHAVLSLMEPGPLAAPIAALGTPVDSLSMPPSRPSLGAVYRLRQAIQRSRPDIIQGWMYHGNLAATLGAFLARSRAPVVWNVRHSLHDLALEKPMTRGVIRLGAVLSKRPQAIIYNARVSARQHEKQGYAADKTTVIANGFDCDAFRPDATVRAEMRATLGIEGERPLIAMICRNHPMKDLANLLDALAKLAHEEVDFQLIVAGRGFDAGDDAVRAAIGARGLDGRVQLLGPRKDVARLLAATDLLAMPSAWGEGFPNVVGEAMASGVPCAVTDVGDAAWVVGEAGRVAPPRDPDALAAAIGALLDLGPEGRAELGAQARARIVENFAIGAIVERYHALYRRMTTADTPPDGALAASSELT